MTADEFANTVCGGVTASRNHGQPLQMASDILAELLYGRIPLSGILSHGFQDNVVQIACQQPLQARRVSLSQRTNRLTIVRRVARFIAIYGWWLSDNGTRTGRVLLANGSSDFVQTTAVQAIGLTSREQLIEHNAQRVDITGCRDGGAQDLLRTGILGRQWMQAFNGEFRNRLATLGTQEFCDSEIQQFRRAIGGHENVPRFQVAMHDKILVRVVDSAADRAEEFEPLGDIQLLRITEL